MIYVSLVLEKKIKQTIKTHINLDVKYSVIKYQQLEMC